MATKPLPELAEGREGAEQRHQIERARQWRRWKREGYDPYAHRLGTRAEGDVGLWREWMHIERHAPKGTPMEQRFACTLAAWDMQEIAHAAYETTWRERSRA